MTHPEYWEIVRSQFRTLDERVYLNAAGMTPLPRASFSAGQEVLERMHKDVRGFATTFVPFLSECREAVARFYGTDSESIAFTGTTSMAMNVLAMQLARTHPSKRVIVTLQDEFPANTVPLRRQGFELRIVAPRANKSYDVGDVLACVHGDTCAVVASIVQSTTGARVDVEELAGELQRRGVPCVVNATQAAGLLPLNLQDLPVAALVASGNKWMLAGTGAAVLVMSQELRSSSDFPAIAGWLSTVQPGDRSSATQLRSEAAALEVGLASLVPIACLSASSKFIGSIGTAEICSRVTTLCDALVEALRAREAELITPVEANQRAGIVSVRRSDADAWVKGLEQRGIVVVVRDKDIVRISPHFYNNEQDIETLLRHW